jgi:hypothetical protein
VRFGDPAAPPPPCPPPPGGPPGPPPVAQGPAAAFTVSPNPTILGLPVTFDASGSTAPAGGRIVRYQWDLDGNGSLETDTAASPTTAHTYLTGPVTVTLQVTDDRGRTATAKRLVVLQRFASLLRVRRSISRRALRRGLALRLTVLPLARRVDVALYRAGRRARLGRRIARSTLPIRHGGTVNLRWRLPARALRHLRPGRYVLRVQGRPTTAHAPILRSIRVR